MDRPYHFGADLFFANDTRFADEIRAFIKHAPNPVQWLVIDAGAITDLDYSAARSVRDLCTELTQRKVVLIFARVNEYLRADMERHGIVAVIGAEHIFPKLHDALATLNHDLIRTEG